MKLLPKLILAFCFFPFAGLAQIASENSEFIDALTWGSEFSIPRSEQFYEIGSLRDETPLFVSADNDNLYIRTIDKQSLDLGSKITLSNTQDKFLTQFNLKGDSLFTLIRQGKRNDGFHHELVVYRLTLGDQAEALRLDIGLDLPAHEKSKHEVFFHVSSSGSYAAVARQKGFNTNEYASIFLSLTDARKGKERHFTLPTQIKSDDLEILGVSCDDNGMVYFTALAGVQLNSPFRKKYLVYCFNAQSKTMHEFDFGTQDLFTREMILKPSKNGMQVVSLYHTDALEETNAQGYAYVQFDSLGKNIIKKEIVAFDSKVIEAHKRVEESVKENEIQSLYLDDIVHPEENTYVVFEKRFKDELCQTDPRTGMIACTDQFHNQSITIENISGNETPITIPRRQVDYDYQGSYSSHQIIAYRNKAIVLYNDNYKNIGLQKDKPMNNPSRSVLRVVTIDENNHLETAKLTEERQSSIAFLAAYKTVLSSDFAFIVGSNGRDYAIGKIDLTKLP